MKDKEGEKEGKFIDQRADASLVKTVQVII